MCFLFMEVQLPCGAIICSGKKIPGVLRCACYPHGQGEGSGSIETVRAPGHAAMIQWLAVKLENHQSAIASELAKETWALLQVPGGRITDLEWCRWKFSEVWKCGPGEVMDHRNQKHKGVLII